MSFFDDGQSQRGEGLDGRLSFSLEPMLGVVPFVVLRAGATSSLTLGAGIASRADVAGATLTLRHPGVWLIFGKFEFVGSGVGDENSIGVGELTIDGVVNTFDRALYELVREGNFARATVSSMWIHRKESLGPEVAQLIGYKSLPATGTSIIQATDTSVIAWTVPGSETLPT